MLYIKKHLFLLLFLALVINSCSPIQGYSGATQSSSQVSRINVRATSGTAVNDYDLTPEQVYIDGCSLQRFNAGINLLPGRHAAEFTWKYETMINDDDTSLIEPTWVKYGRCKINFLTQAGKNYTIEPRLNSSGTWFTDPRIIVNVIENGSEMFLPSDRIIATANCEYSGRSVGSEFDLS